MYKLLILLILLFLYLVWQKNEGLKIKDYFKNNLSKDKSLSAIPKIKGDHHHYLSKGKFTYITADESLSITPRNTYFPKTVKDIQKIIKNNKNRKIRVSGGHHTFNDISFSPDIIIRTSNLNKILEVDKIKRQVVVESGMILLNLNIALEKLGLALHILPAIPWQTIGGALATGTHGSRYDKGSMSSAIIEMTLILANGDKKTFTRKNKEFPAIITNLGCLGVIYSIKIQCEELYVLEHIRKITTWDKFLRDLEGLKKKYPFLQAYIRPYTKNKRTTLYLRRKVETKKTDIDIDKYNKKRDNTSIKKVDYRKDIGHRILNKNVEGEFYTEMEIAIPLKFLEPAVQDVFKLFESHKQYKTKYPILVRFTGKDLDSSLSMSSGRETVFFDTFNVAEKAKDPSLIRFFRDFQNLLVNKYQGRPHYGKRNFLNYEIMKKMYGKQKIDQFNKIRNQLDPQKMFSNNYINKLLGE